MNYRVLMHRTAYHEALNYQADIGSGGAEPGRYFRQALAGVDLAALGPESFIERLVNTKRPQIFAESAVAGDGSDWTQMELSLLGDIVTAVPVAVFDNGLHWNPQVYDASFQGTLLYVPGALLTNGRGQTPVDWAEATRDGEIDFAGYFALYERRLLPALLYADEVAESQGKQALVTVPGLGCGLFAGEFRGTLGSRLKEVLVELLRKYYHRLLNVTAVYYDPYRECGNERIKIGHISFMVRPLTHGNEEKPQLCRPEQYEEDGDDFSGCDLFSVVAWDHVSWPGNDFWIGSRATDDGVKAAATSSMAVMTGVEGAYNPMSNTYDPPNSYRNWDAVVKERRLKISVKENLSVVG